MGEGVRRGGCDSEVAKNHDTGEHLSWDSAGEPGGEASVREELRNVLGKLSYPLAVFSLPGLLAQVMTCPFSLWARVRHFWLGKNNSL